MHKFVDFKAAFDSIRRDFIWTSMRHYGLPEKYIRIFQAFFNGTMSAVRVNGELTDWFSVNSGTGQGDIQGPPLFNFCLNFAAFMAETNKAISHGVVLHKKSKGVGGSNPIFPHDTPKFGFGDGQKWGKSIWKEREKVFVLTNCCTLLLLFSAFLTRIFVYHDLVMTLSS